MKLLFLRLLTIFAVICALQVSAQHGVFYGLSILAVTGISIPSFSYALAPGQLAVYGGVSIADIFIPEVYLDIEPNDNVDTYAFVAAGVVTRTDDLTRVAQSGAKKVEAPLWDDLDHTLEPNYSDDTDTVAAIHKIGVDSWNARNSYLNQVYGAADLARELGGTTPGRPKDPLTRIRNRFGRYWQAHFQNRVIAVSLGVHNDNVANDSGDMVVNVAVESTAAQNDGTMIGPDVIIEATFTLGDRYQRISAIALHSMVYKRLVRQQLIVYIRDAEGKLLYEEYLGMRVIVDDGMPVVAGTTSGLKYLSILYGNGAIGFGEGSPTKPAANGREELQGNGGGNEYIVERKTWMIHPWGFDWTENTVAAPGHSPTLANLRLAANWNRVLHRKKIPMAFLWTNG